MSSDSFRPEGCLLHYALLIFQMLSLIFPIFTDHIPHWVMHVSFRSHNNKSVRPTSNLCAIFKVKNKKGQPTTALLNWKKIIRIINNSE